MLFIYRLTF